MDDLTEIRDFVGKTYTELKKACDAVSTSGQVVMTYIAAAQEISALARDERSISAEEVVTIYDRTRGTSTLSEAIADLNDFPNLLANNPPAISVSWYSGAVTLVENVRDELSRMKRCISNLVDVEEASHVWKPEAIEKHHSDFGTVCFLAGEWSSTSRILKYWAEIKDGTFQNLTYKTLPQEFGYLSMPDEPDIVLVTQLSRAVKQYCRFMNPPDWQPEIEPIKKILNLDQRFKKSLGWPCTDASLSSPPRTVVDGRSTHRPCKAPGWVPSPEFQALMEASRWEIGNSAWRVRECNYMVDMATLIMTRVSRACAPDRPSCVSDLYGFINKKPTFLVDLDENFASKMNKGTSLVVTILQLSGAALVANELDKSWSIFDRKLGRSICAVEDIRSIRAGSRDGKANEAGRHIREILEHDWSATLDKWEDIRTGAVLFSMVVDHDHALLMQLHAAADRFFNADGCLGEGHRIKLFRELLGLDLRFQRSIGWEVLDS